MQLGAVLLALGEGALQRYLVLQAADTVEQQPIDPATQTGVTVGLMLLVGAVLIAGKPVYVNRVVRDVRDAPVACGVWGLVTMALILFVVVALGMTGIGLFVAIPLLFGVTLLGLAGNVLAYLAVVDEAIGNRWISLGIATVAVLFVSLFSTRGLVVNFVVGSIGMGAMVKHWMD